MINAVTKVHGRAGEEQSRMKDTLKCGKSYLPAAWGMWTRFTEERTSELRRRMNNTFSDLIISYDELSIFYQMLR